MPRTRSGARCQFRNAGQFSDNLDISIIFNCLTIAGVPLSHHDYTRDLNSSCPQRFQGKQRVIDRTQSGTGYDQYCQMKLKHQIDHQFGFIEWNQHASGSFNDPADRSGLRGDEGEQIRNLYRGLAEFRRQMRRHRTGEPYPSAKQLLVVAVSEDSHCFGVVILFDSGLNRFPIAQR